MANEADARLRDRAPLLQVLSLWKHYDDFVALRGLSLDVLVGQIVCLLGPSGSGKSTLLRCIAGLELPERGEILFEGKEITGVPVHRRGFGLMFQQFALFPHRSVAENIAFGLRMQQWPASSIVRRVTEMMELVGLQGHEERDIFELSGGEQQRVALARSLAPQPRLLMLDEPLGSLDRTLRERLMDELRRILKEIEVTALYVTHDQQEAFAVADRIVLMNAGEIVQSGKPEELYRRPVSEFAARFFGLSNILPAQLLSDAGGARRVATPIGELLISTEQASATGFSPAAVLIRPEAARLVASNCEEPNTVRGVVVERSFRGGHYRLVTGHAENTTLEWEISTPDRDLPGVGEPITLCLRSDAISILPAAE